MIYKPLIISFLYSSLADGYFNPCKISEMKKQYKKIFLVFTISIMIKQKKLYM